MKKIKLAIVGATGVVGRTVLKVLEEENLPIDEYILFASSKSSGKTIHFFNKDYTVHTLTEHSFDNHIDYAIFSAGSDTSKFFSPIAVKNRCTVIDNSSAFRMDNDVPLIVPEVNPEDIKENKGIIANPNCSTIQAVVALKPLDLMFNIKRIVYSTYQAVSGAGRNGIDDLNNGINNYLPQSSYSNSQDTFPYTLKKFDYPIFNNCIPHIDVFLDNGYTKEEMKMINETRKILKKPDLPITATAVRVPVFNSHCESINIEFEKNFDLNHVVTILKNSPGIEVLNDSQSPNSSNNKNHPIYPLPTYSSGSNKVFIGRIRRDFSVKNGLNIWVVADNIRKGAASNAVQILEKLIKLK